MRVIPVLSVLLYAGLGEFNNDKRPILSKPLLSHKELNVPSVGTHGTLHVYTVHKQRPVLRVTGVSYCPSRSGSHQRSKSG